MRVTVLGSGTSHGVPMIGCDCDVCRSTDPRDRRTRPSILIEVLPAPGSADRRAPGTPPGPRTSDPGPRTQDPGPGTFSILVDTSTDLRAQALAHDIRKVDAILFTHSHADHIMGLDEVRRFNVMQRSAMPCYADAQTAADLRRVFSYIFAPGPVVGGGIPQIALTEISGPFQLGGMDIVPVPLLHGPRPILGFRIGAFAYLTDCSTIPDASWPLLAGVRVLILDALRHRPHPTHFNVEQALEVVRRLSPEQTCFTHICHDLPHAATCASLPLGVELAYDGQVLEIDHG